MFARVATMQFHGYPLPEKNPVWLSDNFLYVQLGVVNLQSAAADKGKEQLKMLITRYRYRR